MGIRIGVHSSVPGLNLTNIDLSIIAKFLNKKIVNKKKPNNAWFCITY